MESGGPPRDSDPLGTLVSKKQQLLECAIQLLPIYGCIVLNLYFQKKHHIKKQQTLQKTR
jgi:hypothetical protein